jgi:hypothetical protein
MGQMGECKLPIKVPVAPCTSLVARAVTVAATVGWVGVYGAKPQRNWAAHVGHHPDRAALEVESPVRHGHWPVQSNRSSLLLEPGRDGVGHLLNL